MITLIQENKITCYNNRTYVRKRGPVALNFNDLSKFVFKKYGLKFFPAVPGSTELYLLKSPVDGSYFAMMSRIRQGDHFIATLDLRCGSFSDMIRDLPGFSTPFRLKISDWVGVWLNQVHRDAIENAFDYAFRLAMNGEEDKAIDRQPFIYVPGEAADEKYQAQAIKSRDKTLAKKHEQDVPAAIQRMRASYDYSILPAKGKAKNFYHQAQLMKNYQDNYQNPVVFKRYYPAFHDMTVPQLRTYFTWRQKIRSGEYEKTSTSYAFVYVFELLNNVGIDDPAEGFKQLRIFQKNYVQKFGLELESYLKQWLKDYVLCYHLPQKNQLVFADELKQDLQYHILLHPEDYSAHELLAAVKHFSTYLDKNVTAKKMGPQFEQVFKEIWQVVLQAKLKNGQDFFSKYIAQRHLLVENLFAGAVFYWRNHDFEPLVVDSERKYFYQNQEWYCSSLFPIKRQKSELNAFLHETDRLLREKMHFGQKLKPRKLEKEFLQAIADGIAEYQKQVEKAKRPHIKINFANLDQIRADASETRDSLLTDEEKQLEKEESQQPVLPKKSETLKTENNYGLTKDEMHLLMGLLNNEDWQSYIKQHHLMVSILADGINDKLFDEIGDAVIDFDENNQPEIIEDYLSDLKEIF